MSMTGINVCLRFVADEIKTKTDDGGFLPSLKWIYDGNVPKLNEDGILAFKNLIIYTFLDVIVDEENNGCDMRSICLNTEYEYMMRLSHIDSEESCNITGINTMKLSGGDLFKIGNKYFHSYSWPTKIKEIVFPFGYGKYALKFLIRKKGEDKWFVQSIAPFEVRK